MLSCLECGRTYKNAASLTTHKYRYHLKTTSKHDETPYRKLDILHQRHHPYTRASPKREETSSEESVLSPYSSVDDRFLGIKIADNKRDIKLLDSMFGSLMKRLEKLESNERLHRISIAKPGVNSNDKMLEEIEAVKLQSHSNDGKINTLVNDILEIKQHFEDSDDERENSQELDAEAENVQDVIDKMMEIKNMFITRKYEALKSNIKDLKQAVTLILRANIGSDILSPDEMELLEEISEPSNYNATIKALLEDNFNQLVYIFGKLNPELEIVGNVHQDEESLHHEISNIEASSTDNSSEQNSETEQGEHEEYDEIKAENSIS